jgi:L-asparagine oxygenase
MCLRGDPRAATTYANVEDIVKRLQPITVERLLQPKFATSVDKSFRLRGEDDQRVVMPVLRKSEGGELTMTYDQDLMRPLDADAADALARFQEAVEESIREVVLTEGDVLVIDNKKTVHGRYPFTARYDGTDRWLMRVLVRKELPPDADYDRGVITTTNFNKVEA